MSLAPRTKTSAGECRGLLSSHGSTRELVMLVHGCIAPWRGREYTRTWMRELEAHLSRKGVRVCQYVWKGTPSAALSDRQARLFLSNLRDAANTAGLHDTQPADRVAVVAKSMGACIVERALAIAASEGRPVNCHVVRVAPPLGLQGKLGTRVTTLRGRCDPLALAATLVSLPFYVWRRHGWLGGPRSSEEVVIGLRHRDWNENRVIREGKYSGYRLFDVFAAIAQSEDLPTAQ